MWRACALTMASLATFSSTTSELLFFLFFSSLNNGRKKSGDKRASRSFQRLQQRTFFCAQQQKKKKTQILFLNFFFFAALPFSAKPQTSLRIHSILVFCGILLFLPGFRCTFPVGRKVQGKLRNPFFLRTRFSFRSSRLLDPAGAPMRADPEERSPSQSESFRPKSNFLALVSIHARVLLHAYLFFWPVE